MPGGVIVWGWQRARTRQLRRPEGRNSLQKLSRDSRGQGKLPHRLSLYNSERPLKAPMAKDVADIAGGFAISRYTARAFDCTWTGIVGRDSEMNHAEPVEHLP